MQYESIWYGQWRYEGHMPLSCDMAWITWYGCTSQPKIYQQNTNAQFVKNTFSWNISWSSISRYSYKSNIKKYFLWEENKKAQNVLSSWRYFYFPFGKTASGFQAKSFSLQSVWIECGFWTNTAKVVHAPISQSQLFIFYYLLQLNMQIQVSTGSMGICASTV